MPSRRAFLGVAVVAIALHAGWNSVRVAGLVVNRTSLSSALTDDTTAKLKAGLGDLYDEVFVPIMSAGLPTDRFLLVSRPVLEAHDIHHVLGHVIFPIRTWPLVYPPDENSTRAVRAWMGSTRTIWVFDLGTMIPDDVLGLRYLASRQTRFGVLHRAEKH